MTMDALGDVKVGSNFDWQSIHEVAVRCRRCHRIAVLRIILRDIKGKGQFREPNSVSAINSDLEPLFGFDKWLDVSDLAIAQEPPQHMPQAIHAAYVEGDRCMAIGCYNAAAAMYRLCLDLATKPLLPEIDEEQAEQPSKRERYNLGPRIDWLIGQGRLPAELKTLAHAVRQDANDGVHDGNLNAVDAADLHDFAHALFERQFTEPEKLRLAEQRRLARRGEAGALAAGKPYGGNK